MKKSISHFKINKEDPAVDCKEDYLLPEHKDFYDYCFDTSTYDIPVEHMEKFATLFHITSHKKALSILESGNISGDYGLHANFAVHPRADLATSQGIVLKFAFEGVHKAVIDIVGKQRKTYSKYRRDVIYHVFTSEAELEVEDGFLNNYWQTIAYPGTKGLIFIGIHDRKKRLTDTEFNDFVGHKIAVTGSESNSHFSFI